MGDHAMLDALTTDPFTAFYAALVAWSALCAALAR